MPSGITGRDGFLPALVKSIRRSFPCRHPTTGGSLKGSPAGTPLTHRFFVLPVLYHRCGSLSTLFLPRAATRRETGRSQRGICTKCRFVKQSRPLCAGWGGCGAAWTGRAIPQRITVTAYFIRENGDFASVFRYREKSPFGQQKSPIYSGFSQETSFCLHIMVDLKGFEPSTSRMRTERSPS